MHLFLMHELLSSFNKGFYAHILVQTDYVLIMYVQALCPYVLGTFSTMDFSHVGVNKHAHVLFRK